MQSLRALQHFVLVAETGSFRIAAEKANLTSPALSNSIKTLEESYGFLLFERSERPIRLTPQGKIVLEEVRKMLFQSKNLESKVRSLRSGVLGHVALGMTAGFSNCHGGAIVVAMLRNWPGITLELRVENTTSLVALLKSEEVELIVFSKYELPIVLAEPEIEVIRLQNHPSGFFCRSGHPILDVVEPSYEDLFRYGLCTQRLGGSLKVSAEEYFRTQVDFQTLVRLQSDENYVLLHAILGSDLILGGGSDQFRREQEAGQIVEVSLPPMPFKSAWCIAFLKGRTLQNATADVKAMVENLVGIEPDNSDL